MSESPRSLPAFTTWPTFPFEGDLRVKRLQDPVSTEPPRHGDNPAECRACGAPDEAYIWVSERWRVRSLDRPTGLPAVLILESRSHLDLGDLPNMLAAELGVMTVRLERAIRSLDGVARVHVNRWGDGAAHLHVWFLARPYGRLQLQGTFLSLWDDILPTIPEDQWRENLAMVAAWLAEFGGRPLAEPPRIDWKAPARLGDQPSPQADEEEVVGVTVAGDAGAPDTEEVVEAAESDKAEGPGDDAGTGTVGSGTGNKNTANKNTSDKSTGEKSGENSTGENSTRENSTRENSTRENSTRETSGRQSTPEKHKSEGGKSRSPGKNADK